LAEHVVVVCVVTHAIAGSCSDKASIASIFTVHADKVSSVGAYAHLPERIPGEAGSEVASRFNAREYVVGHSSELPVVTALAVSIHAHDGRWDASDR